MPAAFMRWALASELETAPSIRFFMRASSSMKKFTVEPVPTPTMAPSGTSAAAAFAAACFNAS